MPLSLAGDGAYSVGIKVGRRSMDVLLIDFTGAVRERSTLDYRFPDPDELLAEIDKRLAALRRKLGPDKRDRVQGVGLAAPLAIGGWQQLLGFSADLAARWQQLDLHRAAQAVSPWPVMVIKDTAAACVAELVGGRGNIATVSHCITRLRFVLNDPAIARPKEIEQLRMVKGCFTNAGQFQVVIGTEGHNSKHGGAIFPDAMRWLWKDHGKVPVAVGALPNDMVGRRYRVAADAAPDLFVHRKLRTRLQVPRVRD